MSYYSRHDAEICDFNGNRTHVIHVADEHGIHSYSSTDLGWIKFESIAIGLATWWLANWWLALLACAVHWMIFVTPGAWKVLAVVSAGFWGIATAFLAFSTADGWSAYLAAILAFAFAGAGVFECHRRGHLYQVTAYGSA